MTDIIERHIEKSFNTLVVNKENDILALKRRRVQIYAVIKPLIKDGLSLQTINQTNVKTLKASLEIAGLKDYFAEVVCLLPEDQIGVSE